MAADGWDLSGLGGAAELWSAQRERRGFADEVRRARSMAEQHWALSPLAAGRWQLRNSGSDSASQLRLAVVAGRQDPSTLPRRLLRGVADVVVGLGRLLATAVKDVPPDLSNLPVAVPVPLPEDTVVAPRDVLDLDLGTSTEARWLEVEWTGTDGVSCWAKLSVPARWF